MRVVEGVCQFHAVPQNVGGRQRTAEQSLGERVPLEVLHDEKLKRRVSIPTGRFAYVEQCADVRVIEGGHCARFALEARPPVGIDRKSRRDSLDGDGAFEASVSSAVDLAHSAGANQPEDFVRTEAEAGREWHDG